MTGRYLAPKVSKVFFAIMLCFYFILMVMVAFIMGCFAFNHELTAAYLYLNSTIVSLCNNIIIAF